MHQGAQVSVVHMLTLLPYPADKPGAWIRQPYGSTEGGTQSPERPRLERPRLERPELGLTARLTACLEIWRDASSFYAPKVAYE